MVRSTSFAGLGWFELVREGSKATMLLHNPFGMIQMENEDSLKCCHFVLKQEIWDGDGQLSSL